MTERKIRKTLLRAVPFETERLILRYIEQKDALDMFEYASRADVCEYLLWSPHINLAATEGYIEFLEKRYIRGLYADWALVLKEEDKMIGTCGYAAIDTSKSTCEVGYVLSPEYQGHGYMTEAVNAILYLSFEKLGFESAHLRIIKENIASIKLAERTGFHFERIGYSEMEIKGVMRDIAHYVITKEEYDRIKNEAV